MRRREKILMKFLPYLQYMDGVDKIFTYVSAAKDGSKTTKALALGAGLLQFANYNLSAWDVHDLLSYLDYKHCSKELGSLVSSLIKEHLSPVSTAKYGSDTNLSFYTFNSKEPNIVLSYSTARDRTLLYLKEDLAEETFYKEIISKLIWKKSKNLFLNYEQGKHSGVSNTDFTFSPIPDQKHIYIGSEPNLDILAERIKLFKTNRIILFIGPTGTGKTTLANLLITKVNTNNPTSFKLSLSLIDELGSESFLDLVKAANPSLLILDDIPLHQSESLLETLEMLHKSVPLTICTFMDEQHSLRGETDGSLYFPGMRPGRIDEIVRIYPPNAEQRKAILQYYLNSNFEQLDNLVLITKGLTPAYLEELGKRINVYGINSYEAEVKQLRQMAQIFDVED